MLIVKLLLFIASCVACGIFILWSTDPDPRKFRAPLDEHELKKSRLREESAIKALRAFSNAALLRMPPSFGIANSGAYYFPLQHRVCVSRALLARLTDDELCLILAHEVGHATRRWSGFIRHGAVEEEVAADRVALLLTAATPTQWLAAAKAAIKAEPGTTVASQLHLRASALGVASHL